MSIFKQPKTIIPAGRTMITKPAIRPRVHSDVLEAIAWTLHKPIHRWGEESIRGNVNGKNNILLRCRDEIALLRTEKAALIKALGELKAPLLPSV